MHMEQAQAGVKIIPEASCWRIRSYRLDIFHFYIKPDDVKLQPRNSATPLNDSFAHLEQSVLHRRAVHALIWGPKELVAERRDHVVESLIIISRHL